MTTNNDIALVAKQYTTWCYPQPVPDLTVHLREGVYDLGDPSLIRRKLWPRPTEPDDLDILVAGCGTYQAAFLAYTNPNCRITAVDLSEVSLEHHASLVRKHDLQNLTLRQMNLLDVASMEKEFDYVVSTGVLHHLPDPDAGLSALRSVLRPNGVMNLMLYGQCNRAGVYTLREAFRVAGLEQDAESLRVIKATLAALPPWHHVRSYMATANDLTYDSGLIDTFTHPVDRAYSVPEVLGFVRRAGLSFQGWLEPGFYALQEALPSTHPLRQRASTLSPEAQWAVVELVTQRISCHRFLACHPERSVTDYQPSFTSDAALAYKPRLAHREQIDARHVLQGTFHRAQLTPVEASWLRRADGETSIRELIGASKKEIALRFFADLWERGHLTIEIG